MKKKLFDQIKRKNLPFFTGDLIMQIKMFSLNILDFHRYDESILSDDQLSSIDRRIIYPGRTGIFARVHKKFGL